MHQRAISDDADVGAFAHHARLAKRNGEIGAGIRRAIVRLAVEMLVLEEHHRIVAADGGAQQAAEIQRGRRHHHAQTRAMRENHFAALAVIDPAAGQIAADGSANHHRRFEMRRWSASA